MYEVLEGKDMKESLVNRMFLILGFFVFVLIFLKVIFNKSNTILIGLQPYWS